MAKRKKHWVRGESMTGEALAEISEELGMLRSGEPETPLEAANRTLLELPSDTTYEEMKARAIEALKISPECVAAHVILGNCEETTENAAIHYEAAVKLGREVHADRIAVVGDSGLGLWAFDDARNFLVAMERLADAVEEGELRLEILQEIIRLNPADNLGVRSILLAEFFVDQRFEDARALLDRHPDDDAPAFVFGRPLLALIKIIEETDYKMPELDFSDPEHFILLRKRLPGSFRHAITSLEDAVRKNPSVALFSLEHGLMEVEIPDSMLEHGPFEAVEYLQEWGPIWLASGLPIFLLQSYVSPKLLKLIKAKTSFRAELRDIQEQLDEAEGESWIEELLDSANTEES